MKAIRRMYVSESPLGDATEVPDDLEETDVPELSDEPDNEPVEGTEPPDVDDQDPEGTEAPEQNKHEE